MRGLILWLLPLRLFAQPTTQEELERFLHNIPSPALQTILRDPARYRFQLHYSSNNNSILSFRPDAEYFYPASLVKLPLALLLLEKISQGTIPRLSLKSRLIIERSEKRGCRATMEELLEQMLVVSDNHAYSCLFHFLGAASIARAIRGKDLPVVLARPFGEEAGESPAVRVFSQSRLIFALGQLRYSLPEKKQTIPIGRAHYDGSAFSSRPMDFGNENHLPLQTVHELLMDTYSKKPRYFALGPDEKHFLHVRLRLPPAGIRHNRGHFRCNAEFKYFFRNQPCLNLPAGLEVSSKAGRAYGFLSDSARIRDKQTDQAFFLTAGLYVNANEILNDDRYEYEELGWPALYALGQAFTRAFREP